MEAKKTWYKTDFDDLEKKNGSFVTTSSEESEVKDHIRMLCFPDMKSIVAEHYYLLSAKNQALVGKLVEKLSGNRDHQGFNFAAYLYWLAKADKSDAKLTQTIIAKYLAEIESTLPGSKRIESDISTWKRRETIIEQNYLFNCLKDNLLFSASLITNGVGCIEIVKPTIVSEYYKHPEFYHNHRKSVTDRHKITMEFLEDRTIRTELEEFAAYTGRKWEDLVDRKYCVINYTYRYTLLDESSRQLVDAFIEELYSQQKKYEDDLHTQQQKHTEEIQALYMQILKNGGVSESDEPFDQ